MSDESNNNSKRNREGHSPRYWKRHPEALRAATKTAKDSALVMPPPPSKDQLSRGDTWTILGVLVGVFFVIILPTLYLKIPMFLGVCIGLGWLAHKSHWVTTWSTPKKIALSGAVVIVCCAISIPQFWAQWRAEHPLSVRSVSAVVVPFVDPSVIASDKELPHVDLTKRPLIKAAPLDGYFCRRPDGTTVVHLLVGVVDIGIPTSLGGWRLHYQSKTLDTWTGYTEINDGIDCDNGKTSYTFKRKNAIYEQTSNRIETGSKFTGWARFEVPGDEYKNAGNGASLMTLEFVDHQDHKYTVTYQAAPTQTRVPHYFPGIAPVVGKSTPQPPNQRAVSNTNASSQATALRVGGLDVYIGNSWVDGNVEVSCI
jgi:hypothetical protein